MPSENDGADDFSAYFASIDIAAAAETVDELDFSGLAEIEAEEPATGVAAKRAGLSPAMAAAIERSTLKLLPGYSGAVSGAVKIEIARAAEAGENLLADRLPVRKRLNQRARRERAAPIGTARSISDLPISTTMPLLQEAKARTAALISAMRQAPTDPRYVKLRGQQGEIARWWLAARLAASFGVKPSHAGVALVRAFVDRVSEETFSRHAARRALDLIRTLENPGGPWHRFAQEKTAHV